MNTTFKKFILLPFTLHQLCMAQVNVTDVVISNVPGNNQVENAVFISPLSKYVIINSNNSDPATPSRAVSYFISSDAGQNWAGNIYGADPTSFADPTVVIDRTERIIVGNIGGTLPKGFAVSYSDDNGANWTVRPKVPGSDYADKMHLWVDNNLNSPYEGRIYSAWHLPEISSTDILITYSVDGGENWLSSPFINISNTLSPQAAEKNWGINLQTGPDGNVYATWTASDDALLTLYENNASICFNKSTDGGNTWLGANRILSINACFFCEAGDGKNMKVFSWPSMAVNQQNGHIYIVWANYGAPGGSIGDLDIYMIKSENDGDSWSNPIRVNQDATTNDQWSPWIACDEISNALVVEYYDSRINNTRANTFVSVSYDEGNTWDDHLVSDVDWNGSNQYYAGMDYIQVDVYHGLAIPVWSDNRDGYFGAYTNPFEIPCPQDLDLIYGNYDIFNQGAFTYDGAYKTTGKINVAGGGSTYKVYQGSEVLMEGKEIVLNDGFETEGEFQAISNSICTNFSAKMAGGNSTNDEQNNLINYGKGSNMENENKKVEIFKNDNFFTIQPNPSTGKFLISGNNLTTLTVLNVLGEIIYYTKINIQNPKYEIDLLSQPKGIYFVKVQTEEKMFVHKIIYQ